MTTTEPPLTPGERVWVEAKAVQEYAIPGAIGSHIGLHILAPDGSVWPHDAWDPAQLRWCRVPDDTAAEHVQAIVKAALAWRPLNLSVHARGDANQALSAAVDAYLGRKVRPSWDATARAQLAPDEPSGVLNAVEPLAAGVPVGTAAESTLRAEVERMRRWAADRHQHLSTGNLATMGMAKAEVWREVVRLLDEALANAAAEANDASAEAADVQRLSNELRAYCRRRGDAAPDAVRAAAGWLVDLVRERDRARKDLELNKAGWAAEIERTKALEDELSRLAGGVPVGALTDEPEPGAYLIGDLLAVRFDRDDEPPRWAIQNQHGYNWAAWEVVAARYSDKPMRRLLPRTQPTTAEPTAEQAEAFLHAKWAGIQDQLQRLRLTAAAEPLTLEAIRDTMREVVDAAEPLAELGTVKAALREVLDERDDEEVTVGEERDDMRAQRDNLAAENARLRQQRDQAVALAAQQDKTITEANGLLARIEAERDEARRERDTARNEQSDSDRMLLDALAQANRERDEARRELQQQSEWNRSQANIIRELRQRVARLLGFRSEVEKIADDIDNLNGAVLWHVIVRDLRAAIAAAAQEPTQTPGGNE